MESTDRRKQTKKSKRLIRLETIRLLRRATSWLRGADGAVSGAAERRLDLLRGIGRVRLATHLLEVLRHHEVASPAIGHAAEVRKHKVRNQRLLVLLVERKETSLESSRILVDAKADLLDDGARQSTTHEARERLENVVGQVRDVVLVKLAGGVVVGHKYRLKRD